MSSPFDHPTAWKGCEPFVAEFLATIDPLKMIVEVGVDHGYSLFKFAEMYPQATVVGIDNFSYADGKHAKEWVLRHKEAYPKVYLMEGDSEGWAKDFPGPDIDVLHIDADHMYDSIKKDFGLWEPHVRPGGVILFHDTQSFPNDVGRFFKELPGTKREMKSLAGLGAWYKPYENK